jgi:rod shape-determining protein MreD
MGGALRAVRGIDRLRPSRVILPRVSDGGSVAVLLGAAPIRKVEVYRFSFVAVSVAAFLALALQSYLPLHVPSVQLLDLPLLVVIYVALTRRDPVAALLAGALIGMAQDSLARGPIGLLGAVKTVIGYVTSSASVHLDTESSGARFLTISVIYGLHFVLFYLLGGFLLGQLIEWDGQARFIGMLVNALVGVLLFKVLDRFRKPA